MKEKLQEYALIAEIIGAIAIVASLIFVGLQVRLSAEETAQNTLQMQAMVYQALQDEIVERNLLNATSPERARLVRKRVSGDALDDVDIAQQLGWNRAVFRSANSAFLHYENGVISKEQLDSLIAPLVGRLNTEEGIRADWAGEVAVTESFRRYVDSNLD